MAERKRGTRPDGLVEVKIITGKDMSGKTTRKSFYGHSKKEARNKAEEYRISLLTGSLVNKHINMTDWINKWLKIYKENTVKGNTLSKYKNIVDNHIVPYFGNAPVAAVNPADIRNFYNLKMGYSADFQHQISTLLFSVFEDAIDNDIIYKNPAKNIKQEASRSSNPAKRVYTHEQAQKVRQFALNHRYGAEIICLLDCGLRRGEMLALQWSDIDLDKKTLHVRRSAALVNGQIVVTDPKTPRSNRVIPLGDTAVFAIQKLQKTSPFLFPNVNGKVQRPDTWDKRHYKIFMDEMIKLYEGKNQKAPPFLNAHELRHTCASLMIEDGVDLVHVSRFLGHSSSNITDKIYVHINVEQLRSAINKNTTTLLRHNSQENSQK